MQFATEDAFSQQYGARPRATTNQYVISMGPDPPIASDVGDCTCVHYESKASGGIFHLAVDFFDIESQPDVLSACPGIVASLASYPWVHSTLSDFVAYAPQASNWAVVAGSDTPAVIENAVCTYVAGLLHHDVQYHQLAYPEDRNADIVCDSGHVVWTFY